MEMYKQLSQMEAQHAQQLEAERAKARQQYEQQLDELEQQLHEQQVRTASAGPSLEKTTHGGRVACRHRRGALRARVGGRAGPALCLCRASRRKL